MSNSERFDTRPQMRSRLLNVLPANPEKAHAEKAVGLGRFPSWLHRKLPQGGNLWSTERAMGKKRLHTVCEEAKCPNLLECWSRKTATFLALGKECTRSCGFCTIQFSAAPKPVETDEPARIARSAKELELRHVVVTMVARDDLPDGGAAHMAAIVGAIRQETPTATIELLTSDFAGNCAAWDTVAASAPNIFNYNIETVRELTSRIRHKATYDRTLKLLSHLKASGKPFFIKSGLMVGFGETSEQVQQAICDLHAAGCQIITIGQYLQANPRKLRVQEFVTPEQFQKYAAYGRSIGVPHMYCGPFVRSSYNADQVMNDVRL